MKKTLLIIIFLTIATGGYFIYREKQKEILTRKTVKEWKVVNAEPTISKLEKYIKDYPNSKFAPAALDMLDSLKMELVWETAKEKNSIESYQKFRAKYPNSKHQKELERCIHDLKIDEAWENAVTMGTIEGFEQFRKNFPNSPYDSKALEKIIDIKVKNTFAGRHGKLPPPQRISGSSQSKNNIINIENNTSFILTVRYSGPQSKEIVIQPQQERSISLYSGHYKVAASVNSSDVIPYAGEYDLKGGKYSSMFYIVMQ